jgi:cytochrome c oxidase assembly factor CtaG
VGASRLRLLTVAALAAWPLASHAHALATTEGGDGAFDAFLAGLLGVACLLYARGVARLWRKAGVGRGVRVGDVVRFALGMITLVIALLSPLDALAPRSFAAHMVEHELLMVVAAPLFVLSRPLEAWAWALTRRTRRAVASLTHAARVRRLALALAAPVAATCAHALALWIWHVPALFVAALESAGLHVLQHACFFASALAFWWAMFGGASRVPTPVSLACLFATMLHTSALGALLTFAPAALYTYANPGVFGLSPLEDQQLGGLVMWVPGGLAYVVVGLMIVASWLR